MAASGSPTLCTAHRYLFEPRKGAMLVGTVNKVGSDHIGLLVEGTWNASIPRSNIPNQYEFDTELGCWCDKDFDHPHIDVGCAIPFVVTGTEVMGEVLSINGTLNELPHHDRFATRPRRRKRKGRRGVTRATNGH